MKGLRRLLISKIDKSKNELTKILYNVIIKILQKTG